jgi:hypothetical protein
MKIGLVGLIPIQLPYRLTGILFYVRRYIFSAILAYLYLKTNDNKLSAIILIIYALIVGVTGSSKGAALIVLAPIAYVSFLYKNKRLGWAIIIAMLVIYEFVSFSRNYIFEEEASLEWDVVFSNTFEYVTSSYSLTDILTMGIEGLCSRIYGMRSAVLSYQYTKLTFDDMVSFYTLQSSLNELTPNIVQDLFGIVLPEDKAYGVGFGYVGTFIIFSNHNFFLAVLQALIIGFIVKIQGTYLNQILNSEIRWAKYVGIGIVLLSFLIFQDGMLMSYIYVATLLLYLLKSICIRKHINLCRIHQEL